MKAIIGHTGFVGSNLIHQSQYDYFYNSKNIAKIVDKTFDILVCSGAPATKWIANQKPEEDKQNIQYLIDCLRRVRAKQVILISTVDVYISPREVTETTPIILEGLHPYGKHRRELELFIEHSFESLIVRLPGLFGKGLKKNIIYDFLHNNLLDNIHRDSLFQFYNLEHLWQDIQTALSLNLKLINLATEPTSVKEVAEIVFNLNFEHKTKQDPAYYNMQTDFAHLFNRDNSPYLYDKKLVLSEIQTFVNKQSPNITPND
jgi:nucleoside-diphosphate-sugar epimerase